MPPKRGIVKSGNSGNSSKAKTPGLPTDPDIPKPLFPPGSKTPLALLNERCQNNGWDRPNVETHKEGDGYRFVVLLRKRDLKTGQMETVKMESHPPLIMPTVLEARHWGATYALYRFCNNLQLHRVLPEGPREYWSELVKMQKESPKHLEWMWHPDPFVARKDVNARQEKAAKKAAMLDDEITQTAGSVEDRLFKHAVEVRMASSLREQVESAVTEARATLPEPTIANPSIDSLPPFLQDPKLVSSLSQLGFRTAHVHACLKFLSLPDTLSTRFFNSLTPLEAALEYLLLHTPESDLPSRFLPSLNSSVPFITSAHSGANDVQRRWIEEKLVKEAGFPQTIVKQVMNDIGQEKQSLLVLEVLGARLIGKMWTNQGSLQSADADNREVKLGDEIAAVQSLFDTSFSTETRELTVALLNPPLTLHFIFLPGHPYPETSRLPPIYLTSTSVPPYMRLHLLSRILEKLGPGGMREPGDGVVFMSIEILEDEWRATDQVGFPNVCHVMQHIMPPTGIVDKEIVEDHIRNLPGRRKERTHRRGDVRNDAQVLQDFETSRRSKAFSDILAERKKLPAWESKEEIINLVNQRRVVIIVGETGCGKTTQLPQFILDAQIAANCGSKVSIIIAQPRRISAISVAARVSHERLEDGSVGYAIRGESKLTPHTKLLFCTTGVVLRRLAGGDQLAGITHIIVDEVHERSIDGDFLLLELKEMLQNNPESFKIILMSATISQNKFVDYFEGAPVIEIPGFTHPVQDFYLEDTVPLINYQPTATKPRARPDEEQRRAMRDVYESQGLSMDSIKAIEAITQTERIDYRLVANIVSHIVSNSDKRGAILIFVTGLQEIRQCMEELRTATLAVPIDILPLHANLTTDEQRRIFAPTKHRKVVVATNVAETSITIEDVVHVIDAGRVKELRYDPNLGLARLEEIWVTRATARQRRGRAGRTRPGDCYKLFTRKQEEEMQMYPTPEILRAPLERLSLQVKVMREHQDVKLFLGKAIDPPDVADMEKAWSILVELGAVDEEGRLTPLGRHISLLPVDLRLAKMLVLGSIFRCLGPILTVTAILSSRPLFSSPLEKRDAATKARNRFAIANSDLLTDANAFDQCMKLHKDTKSYAAVKLFCEENFIVPATLREITSIRQDFLSSLRDIGFVPPASKSPDSTLDVNSENQNLVKAVILGGIWPRIVKVEMPRATFDRVQAGTIERDPQPKDVRMFDESGRVFLHPSSVLFSASKYKTLFLAYFNKKMTSKVYLYDATEVPLYAILLFGGPVKVNHIAGGLSIGDSIKMKAWPRIGVLVNQLRHLLDEQLQSAIEGTSLTSLGQRNVVVEAMLALLNKDGMV